MGLGLLVAGRTLTIDGLPATSSLTPASVAGRAGLLLVGLGFLGRVFGAYDVRRAATVAALAFVAAAVGAAVLALPALLLGATVQFPRVRTRFAAAQLIGSLVLAPLPAGFVLGVAHREARRRGTHDGRMNAVATAVGYGGPLVAVGLLRLRDRPPAAVTSIVFEGATMAFLLGLLAYVFGRAGVDAAWRRRLPSLDAGVHSPVARGLTLAVLWACYLLSAWGPGRVLLGEPLVARTTPVPSLDAVGIPVLGLGLVVGWTGVVAAASDGHLVERVAGGLGGIAMLALAVVVAARVSGFTLPSAGAPGAFWLVIAATAVLAVDASRYLVGCGR